MLSENTSDFNISQRDEDLHFGEQAATTKSFKVNKKLMNKLTSKNLPNKVMKTNKFLNTFVTMDFLLMSGSHFLGK